MASASSRLRLTLPFGRRLSWLDATAREKTRRQVAGHHGRPGWAMTPAAMKVAIAENPGSKVSGK